MSLKPRTLSMRAKCDLADTCILHRHIDSLYRCIDRINGNHTDWQIFCLIPIGAYITSASGNRQLHIMLSSLPGAAVSQVKIEGVLHEFSSIPGVKEDVTEIVMNILLSYSDRSLHNLCLW